MIKKHRMFTITLTSLLIFLSYFLLVYYPLIGDGFDYWHMAVVQYTEKSGFIDPAHSNIGYYILTVIISELSNLSYDIIPTLPLQAIPIILLMIMLLKNISCENLSCENSTSSLIITAVLLVFITKFGNIDYFAWWAHGVGFILALLILSIVTLRFRSDKNQSAMSFILIIVIISINYISYKMTFFAISLISSLQILEWLCHFQTKCKITKKSEFIGLILIGITSVLTFNKVFYDQFIPYARISSEVTSSGIYKALLFFQRKPSMQLDQFYFRSPTNIGYANTVWALLILLGIVLSIVILLKKFIRKENFDIGEKVYLTLIMSSLIILIIYTHLGILDISYLMFSGLVGYVVLCKKDSKNNKIFLISVILFLLLLNTYTTIERVNSDYYGGMRDWNRGEYINAPSKWYIKYMIDENSKMSLIPAKSDVFTSGYFAKEIAKENITSYTSGIFYNPIVPYIFSRDNMLFFFRLNDTFSKVEHKNVFIINYRLNYFAAENWETFSSWLSHRQFIEGNPHLNVIYSSGDIVIVATR